jgi:cell division protein FtsB
MSRAGFLRPSSRRHLNPRRFVQVSLLLLALGLVGAFVFSEYGLRNLLILERTEGDLARKIKLLEARQADLHREKEALVKDPATIERVARERYLLSKPGEITYVFVPVDSAGLALPQPERPFPAVGGFDAQEPGGGGRPR